MKNALIIYGGWEGHEPYETTLIAKEILEEINFNVDVSNSLDDFFKVKNNNYDLIIINVSLNNITKEHSYVLSELVKSGVGLVSWHGGLGDCSRNDKLYQYILGGQFIYHPAPLEYKVNIIDDFLNIEDFTIVSERYYCQVDPSVKVRAVTKFVENNAEVIMPIVWTKNHGRGRVFYSSLGHNSKDFNDNVKSILKRGFVWVSNKI